MRSELQGRFLPRSEDPALEDWTGAAAAATGTDAVGAGWVSAGAVVVVGCGEQNIASRGVGPGGADAAVGGGDDGGAFDPNGFDAPTLDLRLPGCGGDVGACTPRSCTPTGGRYCGRIPDGGGQPLECGDCPAGEGCGIRGIMNVCGKGPECKALTCDAEGGGKYCGKIGDGCGGVLDCPKDCPAGQACSPDGVCRAPVPANCQKLTCEVMGGRYCGKIGDGCGGVLDCPTDCPGGETCGGGGTHNLCGKPYDPNCPPKTSCMPAGGGKY